MLSNRQVLLLAFASAIVTANAYYIHPIIGQVAEEFGVSDGLVGIVPALNQIALALGVLLLLPLGDRVNNARLVTLCLAAQVIALVIMAKAESFILFVIASTILGFFTITPYLLPAYTSRRVDGARLGYVTAVLTTGVIAGVQVSRLASGVIAEYLDWRSVYWLAAGLMVLSTVSLPQIMKDEEPVTGGPSYFTLLRSLGSIGRENHRVLVSGLIQGLNFSIFLALWLGISLHLTSDAMGYGTDLVGYLTLFSVIGLFTTPRLGKWADHYGAERARLLMALIQLVGVAGLSVAGSTWQWLLLPIGIMSIVGPMVDVTGRMTSLSKPTLVRTRLMTMYVTLMFLGGGLGSWTGTMAYHAGGWLGTVLLTLGLSCSVCLLSWQQARTIHVQEPATDT